MDDADKALLRVWHLMALLDDPENNDETTRAAQWDEMYDLGDRFGGDVAAEVVAYR